MASLVRRVPLRNLAKIGNVKYRAATDHLPVCIAVRWHSSSSSSQWLQRQKGDHFTREAKLQNYKSRAAFKLLQIDEQFQLFSPNRVSQILDLGFAPGAWSQVALERSMPGSMVLGVDVLPCEPPHGVSALQANILSKKTHELIRLFFSKHFQLNKKDLLHKDHGYLTHLLTNHLVEIMETETYRELFSPDSDGEVSKTPLDVVISDMYEPLPQHSSFWNNLTNMAYYRMANTSGLAIKDHSQSIDLCDAALITAIDLLKPHGNFVCKLYSGKEDRLLESRIKKVFRRVHRFKPQASRNESKEFYFVGIDKNADVDKVEVFRSSIG